MELPKTKKSLGQHWLTDAATLQAMADAADVGAKDTVLEIGPGTGTLTRILTERAGHVVAIEKDESLFARLTNEQIAKNLQFVSGDILTFDLTSLPADYKVVANIPYYLTSNLIRVLSETANRPSEIALLVQKEVAERVAASPGQMSLLSVSAQFYWEVKLGRVVPANLFTPPPKVDSQILILKRRQKPLFEVEDKVYFQIVKAGYSARRKTLLNSLSGGLRLGKTEVQNWLAAANISPGLRAQTLSLDDWFGLYKAARQQNLV